MSNIYKKNRQKIEEPKNIDYLDQGKGRGIVYECLAKIELTNTGRKLTRENIEEMMQDLAHESMESFVPNPMLGSNPGPRVSADIKRMIQIDEASIIKAGATPEKAKRAVEELSRAVSHLTSAIMEHIMGVPPHDFNFKPIPKDKSLVPEVDRIKKENARIARLRIMRITVFSMIWAVVDVLALTGRKGLSTILIRGGILRIKDGNIMKGKVQKSIVNAITSIFQSRATTIRLTNPLNEQFKDKWIIRNLPQEDLQDMPEARYNIPAAEEKGETLGFDDPELFKETLSPKERAKRGKKIAKAKKKTAKKTTRKSPPKK